VSLIVFASKIAIFALCLILAIIIEVATVVAGWALNKEPRPKTEEAGTNERGVQVI
jgi:hypothetical protein